MGTLPGRTPAEQAEYLTHFRADAIVRDAEWIRRELGVERWSVLGQSFGGFCVTTYLSLAPEGLREAFVTGGLPPLGRPADDVYRATYERVLERNRRYYERYPGDRERVLELRRRLDAEDVPLPGGDRLTGRRLRQLGNLLGMSDGAEQLHYILELPADSPAFLHDVEAALGFAATRSTRSSTRRATRTAARRAGRPSACCRRHTTTRLSSSPASTSTRGCSRTTRRSRRCARRPSSSPSTSGRGSTTPSSCARTRCRRPRPIYADDMYVERAFSEETAAQIRGLRPWVTNEYEHNGLRADGERILGRLIDLARGRA